MNNINFGERKVEWFRCFLFCFQQTALLLLVLVTGVTMNFKKKAKMIVNLQGNANKTDNG